MSSWDSRELSNPGCISGVHVIMLKATDTRALPEAYLPRISRGKVQAFFLITQVDYRQSAQHPTFRTIALVGFSKRFGQSHVSSLCGSLDIFVGFKMIRKPFPTLCLHPPLTLPRGEMERQGRGRAKYLTKRALVCSSQTWSEALLL